MTRPKAVKLGAVFVVLGAAYLFFISPVFNKFDFDVEKFRALSLNEQAEYLEGAGKEVSVPELRDFIKLAFPGEPNDKHELSHKLGELAVGKEGIAGFGFCDSLLQFGCFHGAALAAVRIRGNDPGLAGKLWEGCKVKAKFPGNCLHGLGHAIMMIKNYDILPAYEECSRILNNQNDAFWCQDGVSMENISRSMAPAGLVEYGKDNDPYYPCNSIPKQYETVCVRNHIGHLYRLWGSNFSRSVNFCGSFEEKTAKECIQTLGSIISEKHVNDPEGLIKECQTTGAYDDCIEGGVVALSMSKQFDRAEKLCDTLENSVGCFNKIKSFQSL